MNKITTQIKLIGFSLSIIAIALALLTLFLNQKSKNDARVVNIAGKERMLTQKMAKELFLGLYDDKYDLGEFESAKEEFLTNLQKLSTGDEQSALTPPPTPQIAAKLALIKKKSEEFLRLGENLKTQSDDESLEALYVSNNELLAMIDSVVGEYTVEFEAKRERLEALQYVGGFFIFAAILLSVYLTRKIETKFEKFLSETKEIGSLKCEDEEAPPAPVADAGELDMAKNELKSFMHKVEKVVVKAQKALDESTSAIIELESSAKIIERKLDDKNINEKTKQEIESYIDKSEDLTITSLEDIASAKETLKKFTETLERIRF